MRQLIVTGCGRAGTQHVAKLLSRCGILCGHEKVFRPPADTFSFPSGWEAEIEWDGWTAESSWLVVPSLKHRPTDCVVWHQTRDPRKIVRCWRQHRMMSDDVGMRAFLDNVGFANDGKSYVEQAIKYVLDWNHRIEQHSDCRYQIERMNPDLMFLLLKQSGFDADRQRIEAAFRNTERDVGTCGEHVELTWEEIAQVQGGHDLMRMSRRYGYEVGG